MGQKRKSTVGHVLFELVKVSGGVGIYAWFRME